MPDRQGAGADRATAAMLAQLAPLAGLSPERQQELAGLCTVRQATRGEDPLADQPEGSSAFLLRGQMLLVYAAGGTRVVVGGTDDTRQPVNKRHPLSRSKAITDVVLLLVEDDVLDIVLTWDQLAITKSTAAGVGETMARAVQTDWRSLSGMFSLANLRHGVFARLPAAHIDELLKRFERIRVKLGDIVIREGDEGDYYYVVESGKCRVERMIGGAKVVLAELKRGDPFGEEALVADTKRNASVVSIAEGELLRLSKQDFDQLIVEPLLQRVSMTEARERVSQGSVWLDVRYPSEFLDDRLPGAINVPLNEVRNMFAVLDKAQDYIVYCQSGRRSSAAAFLFAQRGFRVSMLEGGLWAAARSD